MIFYNHFNVYKNKEHWILFFLFPILLLSSNMLNIHLNTAAKTDAGIFDFKQLRQTATLQNLQNNVIQT